MTALLKLEHFTGWLASGERGISSEAIVSQLTGQPVGRRWFGGDHPYDPDDFRRCEILLRTYPLARLVFSALMPSRSPVWAALVARWDEIVALIEEEAPGVFTGRREGQSAPRAYALIKECRRAGERP